MKKANKILLILSLILCLIGGVVFGVGCWAGGIDDVHDLTKQQITHYDQEKTPLDAFTKMDVDFKYVDLEILPSDDDRAYLEYHIDAPDDLAPLTATVENDTLQLSDWPGEIYDDIDTPLKLLDSLLYDSDRNPIQEMHVILYLPSATLDRCTITGGAGDMDIRSLNTKDLSLTLSVGDLSLTDCSLAGSTIDLDIGDLTARGLTLSDDNRITLSTGEASLDLANSDTLAIDAKTQSGEINLDDRYTGGALRESDGESQFVQKPDGASGSLTLTVDLDDISLT